MTPKEKAKELVENFINLNFMSDEPPYLKHLNSILAKQCALIAVDEILEVIYYEGRSVYIYWQEVKQEIEKL